MAKKYSARTTTSSYEEPRRWYPPVGPAGQTSACLGLVGLQETSRLLDTGKFTFVSSLVDKLPRQRRHYWLSVVKIADSEKTNTFRFYTITVYRKNLHASSVTSCQLAIIYFLYLSMDINSLYSINSLLGF